MPLSVPGGGAGVGYSEKEPEAKPERLTPKRPMI